MLMQVAPFRHGTTSQGLYTGSGGVCKAAVCPVMSATAIETSAIFDAIVPTIQHKLWVLTMRVFRIGDAG
jgi:hypothetical protein